MSANNKRYTLLMIDPEDRQWKRALVANSSGMLSKAKAKEHQASMAADGTVTAIVLTTEADYEIKRLQEELNRPAPPDLTNIFVVAKILLELEFSVDSFLGRLKEAKGCPYCARLHPEHDPECNLDHCLTKFRRGDCSPELVEEMRGVLKDLRRIDHRGNYFPLQAI